MIARWTAARRQSLMPACRPHTPRAGQLSPRSATAAAGRQQEKPQETVGASAQQLVLGSCTTVGRDTHLTARLLEQEVGARVREGSARGGVAAGHGAP